MENLFKYKQGQKVRFEFSGIKGEGVVVGVATVSQVIIGPNYIVEVKNAEPFLPNETYPYSHICVFECWLEPIEEIS